MVRLEDFKDEVLFAPYYFYFKSFRFLEIYMMTIVVFINHYNSLHLIEIDYPHHLFPLLITVVFKLPIRQVYISSFHHISLSIRPLQKPAPLLGNCVCQVLVVLNLMG
jgi:hypothetical protein